MPFTKIQIQSLAAGLLGKGPVSSLADLGNFGAVLEEQYNLLKASKIAPHNWRFATKIQQLTQLVETPPVDIWKYVFALPADYMALRRVFPTTTNFQIFEFKKLFANTAPLSISYRYTPDEAYWPSYFVDYFTAALARRLALAVAESSGYADQMRAFELEQLPIALSTDAQSHPNDVLAVDPLIAVRFAGARSLIT